MTGGGLIDDAIGGEAEARGAEGELGADPLAAAIASGAAAAPGGLDPLSADYLVAQTRLVRLQAKHFDEERRLAIQAAKRKRFADRLKNGLEVFAALVATVIGLGVLILLHDAFTSRSVVVDAFQAPPALAPRGLTGEVVASEVLDQLQRLRDATRGASKGLDTHGAWSSDIKFQAPGTGVSIGEIDRLLRARFGHDLHVGGDLIQTETGGLALTVRGDGVPAETFQGAAGDLAKLAAQAAEYVYGRSQPVQFANYLSDVRNADVLAFLPGAMARTHDDQERAELANLWGNAYLSLNQPARAAEKYRLAMALKPMNWKAWSNLILALQGARGEEAAWREGQAMLRAVSRAPQNQKPEIRLIGTAASTSLDMPLELASNLADAGHNAGAGAQSAIIGPTLADDYALMHDPASAARYMASSDPDDAATKAEAQVLAGYAALERGDAAAAVAPLEAFWKTWLADPTLQSAFPDNPCFLALAYGLTGRMADAEGVFKRTGPWVRCYAMRGDVLEHAGDLAGARRAWAQGIGAAPDLSPVYLHRGVAELNQGDLASAAADLAAANARSPHWADPLKAWGDALARQGRWKQALAKYDAALKYAPAWAALHQARTEAATHAR